MKKALLLSAGLLLLGGTAYADCPTGSSEVTVSITTDRYGSETSWTLTGLGGSPSYASGGPYSNGGSNGAYPQTPVTVCLPDGMIAVFTIYDAYGDGLCCSYGQGTYSVTMGGETVVSYQSFTASRQASFRVGPTVEHDLALLSTPLAGMFGAGDVAVKGTVKNYGTNSVASYLVSYMVDGGEVNTATISTMIGANGQHTFTHPMPWNATYGDHTLKMWVGLVDGEADGYPINDTVEVALSVASNSTQRVALLEEFTSSTCGPCYQLNVVDGFDQFLSNLNTNVAGSNMAGVKYQMNWPTPGNDPSYNSDGSSRRTFYNVGGVPDPYLQGKRMSAFSTPIFNAAMAAPAFADIDLSYTLEGTTVNVTVKVTPYYAGTGHRLYVAITEDFYHYQQAYTPQKDYHYAMRKMLPTGTGSPMGPFSPDVEQTFNFTYTLNEGGPAQGNNNLWGTVDGITIVAFVQKTSTKDIVQAAFVNNPLTMDVQEHTAADLLQVWPNPTNDVVNLSFGKATGGQATIDVFNTLGSRVLSTDRRFATAKQVERINLAGLEPGMYLVRVLVDGVATTRRINLVR